MAAAMTFTSLQEDMRRYLERGDVSDTTVYDQLPRLINLAERAIVTELNLLGFLQIVTTNLVTGVSTYAKPDRWRETVSMNYGTGSDLNNRIQIFPRDYEYCRTYWPNSNDRDLPEFYSDYGYSHWLIVPTPIATYPIEINYYEQPAYLDDSNQTNWLSEYQPNLLLYRSLLEATPFLKNDERLAVWQGMYNTQKEAVDTQDLQRILDRSTTRQEA